MFAPPKMICSPVFVAMIAAREGFQEVCGRPHRASVNSISLAKATAPIGDFLANRAWSRKANSIRTGCLTRKARARTLMCKITHDYSIDDIVLRGEEGHARIVNLEKCLAARKFRHFEAKNRNNCFRQHLPSDQSVPCTKGRKKQSDLA